MNHTRYETDVVAWANEQAALLRAGKFSEIDIYPMDFKMDRGGKGVNPREHSKLCDRGERVQPTKRQLER